MVKRRNESLEGNFTSVYEKKTYLSAKGVPIFEGGKFAGAVLLITDITERKRAEDEVNKSRKFLATIID